MKTSIVLVIAAAVSMLVPVEWAWAKANHRGAIDRKWKQVQAGQQRQDKEFKSIERQAERGLREMDGPKNSRSVVPSNGYQRMCP
jgi:hypothetical protein